MSTQKVMIYTDGAARGNPGKGGFGAVLIWGKVKKEISQGYERTTNNRMELMAVIKALEALKKEGLELEIYSDSNYVVKAVMEGWLTKWLRTGFKGGIKNRDLWMRYHELSKKFKIHFHWVKGHASNMMNNRCDILATEAADGPGLLVDEGYVNGSDNLFAD